MTFFFVNKKFRYEQMSEGHNLIFDFTICGLNANFWKFLYTYRIIKKKMCTFLSVDNRISLRNKSKAIAYTTSEIICVL